MDFPLFQPLRLVVRVAAFFALVIGVASPRPAPAATPTHYYNSVSTASPALLRSSLNDIVTSQHVTIGYDNTWTPMENCDLDPDNPGHLLLMYGRGSRPVSNEHDLDKNAATGGYSREHAFPQSFFNENEPQRSDIHALFPCDADINNYRSNHPYNTVSTPSFIDFYGNRSTTQTAIDVFEPADIDKGRVARAILYMDVRYEGESGIDLKIVDHYPGGTGDGEMAYLTTMLAWHRQFPPDAFERARNHKAYRYQKNANPFTDHPEWVPMIYGGSPWDFANGDSLAVSGINRLDPNLIAGLVDAPVLQLNLALAANQYHVGSVTVTTSGTATAADVPTLRLWYDVNNDGQASTTDDTLLGQVAHNAGGQTTFTLSHPFFVARGNTKLLLTANTSAAAVNGRTFKMSVEAPGIVPHASGGIDTPPAFTTIQSNTTIIGNASGPVGDLIISEVFEGNGLSLKYVEIQNPTSNSVSLTGAKLRIFRNANPVSTFFDINLTGSIPANDFFVIANNSTDFLGVYGFAADQYNGNLDHNGNDKYQFLLADNTVQDTFAADRIGNIADFAADRVAYRQLNQLPNDGAWGNSVSPQPNDASASPSGYWFVRTISSANANATIVGTPGAPNPIFNRVELDLTEFGLHE